VFGNERTRRFLANGTIKAGQVVCFEAAGIDEEVIACVAGAGTQPIGVAVHPAVDGEYVTVALDGTEVEVCNADDTATIDAGALVEWNDNAIGGTVSEFAPRAALGSTVIDGTNDTTIDGLTWIIGQAIKDGATPAAAAATVRIIIRIQLMLYSDHAVV
jgi:hypothetical protein